MNKKNKYYVAGGLGIVALAGAFFAGAYASPRTVTVEKIVEKEIIVPGEIVYEPVVTTEVVEKNVTVEIPVDNGNLELVLKELVEKDGDLEYLTEGLDDDEIDFVVDRIFLTQQWERMAFDRVKAKLFDELDKEVVNNVSLDEDDLRSLNIDVDDITFEDIDFDDRDVDVLVPFTFRQDEQRFEGVARVVILDNEIEDLFVEEVSLK